MSTSQKLLETIADISYTAGYMKFSSGDSREDVNTFIFWAEEFQKINLKTNWDEVEDDYIISIDKFTVEKIKYYKKNFCFNNSSSNPLG